MIILFPSSNLLTDDQANSYMIQSNCKVLSSALHTPPCRDRPRQLLSNIKGQAYENCYVQMLVMWLTATGCAISERCAGTCD